MFYFRCSRRDDGLEKVHIDTSLRVYSALWELSLCKFHCICYYTSNRKSLLLLHSSLHCGKLAHRSPVCANFGSMRKIQICQWRRLGEGGCIAAQAVHSLHLFSCSILPPTVVTLGYSESRTHVLLQLSMKIYTGFPWWKLQLVYSSKLLSLRLVCTISSWDLIGWAPIVHENLVNFAAKTYF